MTLKTAYTSHHISNTLHTPQSESLLQCTKIFDFANEFSWYNTIHGTLITEFEHWLKPHRAQQWPLWQPALLEHFDCFSTPWISDETLSVPKWRFILFKDWKVEISPFLDSKFKFGLPHTTSNDTQYTINARNARILFGSILLAKCMALFSLVAQRTIYMNADLNRDFVFEIPISVCVLAIIHLENRIRLTSFSTSFLIRLINIGDKSPIENTMTQ